MCESRDLEINTCHHDSVKLVSCDADVAERQPTFYSIATIVRKYAIQMPIPKGTRGKFDMSIRCHGICRCDLVETILKSELTPALLVNM